MKITFYMQAEDENYNRPDADNLETMIGAATGRGTAVEKEGNAFRVTVFPHANETEQMIQQRITNFLRNNYTCWFWH